MLKLQSLIILYNNKKIKYYMQPNSNYKEQNTILAELHKLRQQRINTAVQLQPAIRTQNQQKQKKQEKWELEKTQKSIPKLYLAPLVYDYRSEKPSHYLPVHRLFNQNVHEKSLGFDTKRKIKSIFMTTFGFEEQVMEPIAKIGCNLIVLNPFKDVNWVYKENYAGYSNWTVVRPVERKGGYGVFHTKLWLIKFEKFLRVVVSTGNLHLGDWAVWANAYWYQDFQNKSNSDQQSNKSIKQLKKDFDSFDKNQDFYKTLKMCYSSMMPPSFPKQKIDIKLEDYAFENIDIVLIPSIPGTYSEQSYENQGIGKIKKVIKHFKKKGQIKQVNPIITANTSSLGQMSIQFIQQMYYSFSNESSLFSPDKIKVIYPSLQYINNQAVVSPDPLFYKKDNYEKHPDTKSIFHKLSSNLLNPVSGLMPHLKTIVVDDNKGQDVVFYIGSHNLTKAAWGSMSKNNKLTIANSELGVLFLQFDRSYLSKWLPFKYPPDKYSTNQIPFTRSF